MKIDKEYLLLIILFLLCAIGRTQDRNQVWDYIQKTTLKHKDVVLKQSILETGHYKSYSCRERHNLFGFTYNGNLLIFDHWKKSVDYYVWWQGKYYEGGDYYEFLDCLYKRKDGSCVRYAKDRKYTEKLKKIK